MGGPYAPPSAAERMACVAPVLCLRPMTHGDARYAEGRRAGLLEAAAMLLAAADELPASGPVSRMLARCYEAGSDLVLARAGEP